jgi:hypothetical protein
MIKCETTLVAALLTSVVCIVTWRWHGNLLSALDGDRDQH